MPEIRGGIAAVLMSLAHRHLQLHHNFVCASLEVHQHPMFWISFLALPVAESCPLAAHFYDGSKPVDSHRCCETSESGMGSERAFQLR
jgi:hypothetical protein